jgi:hypothetical protein
MAIFAGQQTLHANFTEKKHHTQYQFSIYCPSSPKKLPGKTKLPGELLNVVYFP